MPLLQDELEALIRNGQTANVRERLLKLNVADVARADAASIAGLARRAGLPELSLRLLTPIVRPVHPLKIPANVNEISIYAAALARIGAYEEAMSIFTSLRKVATADVWLFEAFAQIHQWNYAEAIPCLRKYLNTPDLSEYNAVIGKMNLAACHQYVGTHAKEKDELLREILASCAANNWVRMELNALELSAQSAISRGDFFGAEELLSKLSAAGTDGGMFVEKWRAVLALKNDPRALGPLHALREKAVKADATEIIRECDFYEAVENKNAALAVKVYFGSTAPSYRKRLKDLTKDWLNLPAEYIWTSGTSERILDLVSGKDSSLEAELKPGHSILRLLQFLCSDFYRSFPLGSLFAHLYSSEVFNVDSSPSRVRRIVERLREWLVQNSIPLHVDLQHGQYRLVFTGAYGLRLPKNILQVDESALDGDRLARLRAKYGPRGFSSKNAAEALDISVENARKFLKSAVEKKKLRVEGRGRSTQFRFAK